MLFLATGSLTSIKEWAEIEVGDSTCYWSGQSTAYSYPATSSYQEELSFKNVTVSKVKAQQIRTHNSYD